MIDNEVLLIEVSGCLEFDCNGVFNCVLDGFGFKSSIYQSVFGEKGHYIIILLQLKKKW